MARWGIEGAALAAAALALTLAGCATPLARTPARFAFGVVGDAPYSASEEARFLELARQFNDADLAFVIHLGDIKAGDVEPCSDELYLRRLELMRRIDAPVILTPGDNEWTDCGSTGFDPLERLERLRELFFADSPQIAGSPSLKIRRQGDSADYPDLVENALWLHEGIAFATLHLVRLQGDDLSATRTRLGTAAIDWLRETFATARARRSAGVVLAIHANPDFGAARRGRESQFERFLEVLTEEVQSFEGQVVLLHGDTHYFRIDKPLLDPDAGEFVQLVRFTRVETFGAPNLHWLRIRVDARDPALFQISPRTR